MLEIPGGGGNGGIRFLGKYVGNVCGKSAGGVGKWRGVYTVWPL